MSLLRVAIAQGTVYCSPGCGAGCTKAAFDTATATATAHVERLGQGWKPHVFENLGWHWYIHYGERLTIWPSHAAGKYWADFSSTTGQITADGDTPEETVANLRAVIQARITELTTELEQLP